MSAHTPAPWELRYSVGGYWFIDHEQGGENYTLTALECKEANARLITAAPDLLAAARCALADLEGMLPEFDPEHEHPAWETLAELRAAITKATGEAA